MKFTVSKSDFSEILGFLKGVIPQNSAMPTVLNFYVKALSDKLEIIGTNLENTIKLSCSAKVDVEGEIILPYSFVSETVMNIPSSANLECEVKKDFFHINALNSKYKFVYAKTDDFPMPPEFSEKKHITIGCDILKNAIKKTLFAASTDKTSRIHLSGLNFKLMQNVLNVAATDVRRLSYIKIPVSSDDEFSFTVQAETLKEVRKLCEKYSNVDIILTENENQIVFRFENTIFFSKLLEDEFPDYLSIIPDNFVSRLVIPTDKFRDMLKMARPVANAASVKSIIVKLENSQLGIKAEAEEQGEFETFYQVVSEGDNAEINFNIEYIMQA
ncbi:MAG: DNA polymerase III subunit beta, partial [Candidatus Muiribacteriota bacterium]